MSNAADLGAVTYEAESSWGENVETFATHRIPILNPIDTSGFRHDAVFPQGVYQTLQGGPAVWIKGIQAATFKMKMHLAGHGSATTGAVTVDPVETLYGLLVGNATRTATAGTTAGAGTATVLTTAASGTFSPGGLFRLGAGGITADARGNGQAGVVSTHITTALTSLVAFDAAPSGTDAVKPCVNLYIPEDPLDASAQITGLRLQFLTANYRYRAHGCFATGFTIGGLNTGETPWIEFDMVASWWEYTAAAGAFPSAVASNFYLPNPTAGGSLFFAPVGTATRSATTKRNPRSFTISVALGVAQLMGMNGVSQYQTIVGAIRTPTTIKASWTEDSGAAADSPELDGFFMGTTAYHLLWTGNPVDGKSVAIYLPNVTFCGARPTQRNVNKVNRVPIEVCAYSGPDTTSQLSQSAMRLGLS